MAIQDFKTSIFVSQLMWIFVLIAGVTDEQEGIKFEESNKYGFLEILLQKQIIFWNMLLSIKEILSMHLKFVTVFG